MTEMDMEKLLTELKRIRDETALQIHLGTKEAQDEWAELEKKWEKFATDAELDTSADDIKEAAGNLGNELKAAYERIRKAIG